MDGKNGKSFRRKGWRGALGAALFLGAGSALGHQTPPAEDLANAYQAYGESEKSWDPGEEWGDDRKDHGQGANQGQDGIPADVILERYFNFENSDNGYIHALAFFPPGKTYDTPGGKLVSAPLPEAFSEQTSPQTGDDVPGNMMVIRYGLKKTDKKDHKVTVAVELTGYSCWPGIAGNAGSNTRPDVGFDVEYLVKNTKWRPATYVGDRCVRIEWNEDFGDNENKLPESETYLPVLCYDMGAVFLAKATISHDLTPSCLIVPPDYDNDSLPDVYEIDSVKGGRFKDVKLYSPGKNAFYRPHPEEPKTREDVETLDGLKDTEVDAAFERTDRRTRRQEALGDGFTAFEEYRGFVCEHSPLEVRKEVMALRPVRYLLGDAGGENKSERLPIQAGVKKLFVLVRDDDTPSRADPWTVPTLSRVDPVPENLIRRDHGVIPIALTHPDQMGPTFGLEADPKVRELILGGTLAGSINHNNVPRYPWDLAGGVEKVFADYQCAVVVQKTVRPNNDERYRLARALGVSKLAVNDWRIRNAAGQSIGAVGLPILFFKSNVKQAFEARQLQLLDANKQDPSAVYQNLVSHELGHKLTAYEHNMIEMADSGSLPKVTDVLRLTRDMLSSDDFYEQAYFRVEDPDLRHPDGSPLWRPGETLLGSFMMMDVYSPLPVQEVEDGDDGYESFALTKPKDLGRMAPLNPIPPFQAVLQSQESSFMMLVPEQFVEGNGRTTVDDARILVFLIFRSGDSGAPGGGDAPKLSRRVTTAAITESLSVPSSLMDAHPSFFYPAKSLQQPEVYRRVDLKTFARDVTIE